MPTHTRIRMFNTKETYPNQSLDNDLCQAVRAGNTVYVRGQVGTDFAGNLVGLGDPQAQAEQASRQQQIFLGGQAIARLEQQQLHQTELGRDWQVRRQALGERIDGIKAQLVSQQEQQADPFAQRMREHEASQRQQWQEQVNQWRKQVTEDPQIGGANLPATVARAQLALDRFDESKRIGQLLEQTGYGNNPDVLRFFNRLADALMEDGLVQGQAGGSMPPLEERMYAGWSSRSGALPSTSRQQTCPRTADASTRWLVPPSRPVP